jgi:nitric oxide dioxygenase
MLKANPSLRNVFNNANQEHLEQPRALADAVLAYAANIDDLSPMIPAVELIASKHASLYVQPEQYAIVGERLIAAIGEVLGDAVTPELADAWVAAYWQLAGILIKKEHSLYDNFENWRDWRDFRIAKKVKESDEITSFYLEPVGGGPLPTFRPGQVRLRSPLLPTKTNRTAVHFNPDQRAGAWAHANPAVLSERFAAR